MPEPVLAPVRTAFRAIAGTIVPEARALGEADWRTVEGLIEDVLAMRPAAMRRQLQRFIRFLWWLPLVMRGRTFGALGDAERATVLHAIERGPVALLRRGLWGLRTLVFLGFYARPEAAAAVGWRSDPRGWGARGPEARRSGARDSDSVAGGGAGTSSNGASS